MSDTEFHDELPLDPPEVFFSGPTLELWNTVVPKELTDVEVAFLLEHFRDIGGRNTAKLLDVACGSGRHALALAKKRLSVTGLDIAEGELKTLEAAAKKAKVSVRTICADMRNLGELTERLGTFDGAYIFGNAIGYMDPDTLAEFFENLAELIREGGRLVFDTAMLAETLLHRFEDTVAIDAGTLKVVIDNDYDVFQSRLVTTHTYTQADGSTLTKRYAHWVLTTRELINLVEDAGFEIEQLLGDTEGSPFEVNDPRLLVVARRVND